MKSFLFATLCVIFANLAAATSDPYHTKSLLPGVPNPSSRPTVVPIICDQDEINICMRSNSLATRQKCEALLKACVYSKKKVNVKRSILPGVPNPNATTKKSLLPGVPNPSARKTTTKKSLLPGVPNPSSVKTKSILPGVTNPFATKTVTRTKSILPGVPNPSATPAIINNYSKCSKDDWECKTEMSKRCYEETKECKRSNSLAIREKCNELLKICQNIWN